MKATAAELTKFFTWTTEMKLWDTFYIDETDIDYDEKGLAKLDPAAKLEVEGYLEPHNRNDGGQIVAGGVTIDKGRPPSVAVLLGKWRKAQTSITRVITIPKEDEHVLLMIADEHKWKVSG
jgi:hypothetical protein